MRCFRFIVTLSLAFAPLSVAQVGLPSVRLPAPGVGLPSLPATDPSLQPKLDAELRGSDLTGLRRSRIRTLLRTHRDSVEADDHGNPFVRGELVLLPSSGEALRAVEAAGLTIVRESTLDALGIRIVLLHISSGTLGALERLRAADPEGVYDLNHIYLGSGKQAQSVPQVHEAPAADAGAAGGSSTARLGLIDSGVDAEHEVFRTATLHPHGCSGRGSPDSHGTAVASLMVGSVADFHGAAPGAELYAVDVYCGSPTGGSVAAVAEAFEWLAQQRVPVINVSLVGPDNHVLGVIVERLIARGHIIVAAVGNDGPAAPPLFPAAWPGVIGVTAVDARRRVLVEAGRGVQVRFAAPGAQMVAARLPSGYALVRGTSFAAPIVAGLLSLKLQAIDKVRADAAVAALAGEAVDLGAPGPDVVYGYGLVGESLRRQPALAAFRVD